MRKKSAMQNNGGYNNNNKKRYSQGGGGSNNGNNNRPRKNYGAAREKYLSQARDALAAGDRVLAENFFQHAEHCYRMMVEEGHHHRHQQGGNQNNGQQQGDTGQDNTPQDTVQEADSQEELGVESSSQLPAFLTAATYSAGAQAAVAVAEQPAQPDWEE